MICLVVTLGFAIPNRMGFASIQPRNYLSQTLSTILELKEEVVHPLFNVDKALKTTTKIPSSLANSEDTDVFALKSFLQKKITTEVKWHYSDLKTRVSQLSDPQLASLQQKIAGGKEAKKLLDTWSGDSKFQKNLIEDLAKEEKIYQAIQQRKMEKLSKSQLLKLSAFFGLKDLDQL